MLTVVADSTPDDGSFTVPASVTQDIWVGSEYRVRITHLTNGAIDDSDGDFTIAEAPNTPPVAAADAYATDEDTPLAVAAPGVLTNDSDADLDTLTAVLDTDVTSGTLTLNPDGSFDYTPNADWSGFDSFTYKANDGTDDSNTVTVDITVNNTNDAPVAADDATATAAVTPVVIDVLVNDTDVDVGDTLSVSIVTQGADGSVVINGDDTVTYTPDSGFSGDDTFTYTVDDGNGGTDTATVTVTVSSAGAFPPVTGLTATARSERRIDLAWQNPADPGLAGVVIFRRQGAQPTFVPADGASYTAGTAYGDATCVHVGTGASFEDDDGGAGLTAGTQYFYVVHAHDGTPDYAAGVPADATTTAAGTPPTVAVTLPPDGADGVLLTAPIIVIFSEPMDTAVLPDTVLSVRTGGVDAGGFFAWSADGESITFEPAPDLTAGTAYTVEVATTATDEEGNALAAVETFTFTTRTPGGGLFGGGGCSPRAGTAWVIVPLAALALALLRRRRREASAGAVTDKLR